MNIATKEHGSSAAGRLPGVSGVHGLARLCLYGLVLGASVFALRAQPAPATTDQGGREAAATAPEEQVVRLDKVVVTPSRFGIAEERLAPNVTLTNAELETLPQLGEDLYRTISPGRRGTIFPRSSSCGARRTARCSRASTAWT